MACSMSTQTKSCPALASALIGPTERISLTIGPLTGLPLASFSLNKVILALRSCKALEHRDQCGVVEQAATRRRHRVVELADKRGHRQRRAGLLASCEGNAKVLAMEVDAEAWLE